jgi:hypothetical protein
LPDNNSDPRAGLNRWWVRVPGTSIYLGPRLLALLPLLCVNGAVVIWGLRSFATPISPVLPTVTVREGLVAGAVFPGWMGVVHEAAHAAVVAGLGGTALRCRYCGAIGRLDIPVRGRRPADYPTRDPEGGGLF